jgi:hypothetical protein
MAKRKTTYMCTFTPGLKQVVRFLKMMTGDENGDDSMSVSKANANPNPGKTDYSVVSQNSY